MILWRIVAVDGPARVNVMLDVRAGFGRSRMTDLSRAGGCWTGRSGRLRFRWSGAAKARPGADGLALTVTLPAGGHHDLVLELSDRPLDARPPDPGQTWDATEEAWSAVVPACDDLIAARDARHAYAVLRGSSWPPRHLASWRVISCECLDHILILGARHLRTVLAEYGRHYYGHRPRQSLRQKPPRQPGRAADITARIERRQVLGGLISEYRGAA